MSESEIKNAVIESARLSFADRGILDAWLQLDYGGTCQGFGGYALYLPKSFKHHQIESVAGHYLFRVMEIAGVDSWDNLPGRTIRVRGGGWNGPVEAIGHIIKDDWFSPAEDCKALKKSETKTQVNWVKFHDKVGPHVDYSGPKEAQVAEYERAWKAWQGVPLPAERKPVLCQIAPQPDKGLPAAVAVGYLRYAAGDKDCPFFVIPGVGGQVTAYADVLPESLNAECWPGFCEKGVEA